MKLTAKQKLERAYLALMSSKYTDVFTGVMMVGSYRVETDPAKCPTAYTDGIDVVYGEQFINKLEEKEIRAVILHETLHKTYQQLFVWRNLFEQGNPKVANIAVDAVVNILIHDIGKESDGFVKLPEGGVPALDKYRGWDAGQVYRDLMQNAKQVEVMAGKGGQDEHGWGSKEDRSVEIEQAIRQGKYLSDKKNAGSEAGSAMRAFGDLTKPETNWKEQVSEFMTDLKPDGDISTWRRPNRRWLQHDIYMPTYEGEAMGNLVVAIDTSGSIDQELITAFLSHVQAISMTTRPERIDLLYWDTEVAAHEVYAGQDIEKLVTSTKPAGGGGSDPTCCFEHIEKYKINPDVVIVLTDGYIDFPKPFNKPTLWGIITDVTPPWGKIVRIRP